MNIHLDRNARFARIRAEMARHGIDVLVGTRSGTVNWIAGAYLPWRSLVVFPRDGEVTVYTFLLDLARPSASSSAIRSAPTRASSPPPSTNCW